MAHHRADGLSQTLDRAAAQRVSPRPEDAAAERPLDLHEGISEPQALADPQAHRCTRWPEHFALLNGSTGELVQGRCRATNLCRYCQTLYVVETVEMLTLDAAEFAPNLWGVLTAREHLTRRDTYDHLQALRRSARKLWPDVEWFVQVEFQRRGALHLNLVIKGVPDRDLEQLRAVLVDRWCARVDAAPVGQWFDTISDAGGVVRYLQKTLSHGLKREQAPPIGWRGHRTSQTRGYLVRPASVMREEARRSLRAKRELWKLLDAAPDLDAATAEDALADRLAALDSTTWTLARVPGRRLGRDLDAERRIAVVAPFVGGSR